MTKICIKCGIEKSLSEFNLHSPKINKTKLKSYCKTCSNAKAVLWAKENPKRCAGHTRSRKYGVIPQAYEILLDLQKGCCAICDVHYTKTALKRLALDHDHNTNTVRGLLCDPCNIGLGVFKDSKQLLQKAQVYLNDIPTRMDVHTRVSKTNSAQEDYANRVHSF